MKKKIKILGCIGIIFLMFLGINVSTGYVSAENLGEAKTYSLTGARTITVTTAGEYQNYSFTTPAEDGHFFLKSKNISIPAHTVGSYANLFVEIYDTANSKTIVTNKHMRPDYDKNYHYSDCELEPSTSYNVRIKSSWTKDGDYELPGELEYEIIYKSDPEADTKDKADSLGINEEYEGTLVSNIDEDWFVLRTDSGTQYELYTKNIDIHTHSSWYYDELMYRATLYDATGAVVTDIRLPINDKQSRMLELKPNSTYYIQIKNYCEEPAKTRLEENGEYLISLGHPMITESDVVLEKTEYIFTGNEIRPGVTVTYKGEKLTENEDYTVKYEDNIEKGTGKVIVTGINNYGGVVTKEFTIGGYTEITVADEFVGTVGENILIEAGIKTNICAPNSSNVTWRLHHSYDAETDFGTMTAKTVAKESYTISNTFKTNVPGKYELEIETKDGEIAKTKILVKPAKVEEFSYINHVGWIRLGWKKMENIDGYRIEYSWEENGSIQKREKFVSPNLEETDIKKLLRGAAHEFEIRAFVYVDDEYIYGEGVEVDATIINLPLTMDCWGFSNPSLGVGMQKKYFSLYIPKAQAYQFSWDGAYNGWNGLCYGLSKAAGQILIDSNPPIFTYGVESLNEFKSWDDVPEELQEKIKYAHASQVVYKAAGSIEVEIDDIVRGVHNYLYNDGFPVYLRIKKNLNGEGGHILWAQDYSQEKDGTVKIYVYDTNYPSSDQGAERILTLSGENRENWSYDAGALGQYGGKTGITESGQWTLGAGTYGETTTTDYDLLEVDTTNSSDTVDITEFTEAIEIDSYAETGDSNNSRRMYWISPQDIYKISQLPAGAKITIAMKNSSTSVQVSEDSELILEMDDAGTFDVEVTSTGTNDIVTSFYEYDGNERTVTTTTVTSPAGSDVVIEKKNNQVKISGIEKLAVTETVEVDKDDEYKKIIEDILNVTETMPDKEYLVEEGEKETVLKEDTKGDGSFDTIVSEFDKQDNRISFEDTVVSLSEYEYIYNGKQQIPSVKVTNNQGEVLAEGVDYIVEMSTDAINPGKQKVVIKPKGIYCGSEKELYYEIVPLAQVKVPSVKKDSSTKIVVSWQKVSGMSGYEISKSSSKSGTSIVASTTGSSKILTVTANKNYYYKVRAYKTINGNKVYGPWSSTAKYVLRSVSAQGTITATLYGYDDVKLSWKTVKGANAYDIYYKAGKGDYKKLATTTSISYKKANLSDGKKYTFKVIPCYKSDGKILAQGTSKTVGVTTLKKLNTPKITKASSKKVKVTWNNIEGESGYQISKSTSKTKTKIVSTYKTTSGKTKTLTAKKGKTYYYKVRAYKVVGSKKIYGPWSAVKTYKLK